MPTFRSFALTAATSYMTALPSGCSGFGLSERTVDASERDVSMYTESS
jgi:hypothetical protein